MANYEDRLRRLAINNPRQVEDEIGSFSTPVTLDPKMLALTRLASLIAIGGSEPSFGEQVDAALGAGASTDEIVDMLTGVCSIVGVPRVVSAASKIAMALGVEQI